MTTANKPFYLSGMDTAYLIQLLKDEKETYIHAMYHAEANGEMKRFKQLKDTLLFVRMLEDKLNGL